MFCISFFRHSFTPRPLLSLFSGAFHSLLSLLSHLSPLSLSYCCMFLSDLFFPLSLSLSLSLSLFLCLSLSLFISLPAFSVSLSFSLSLSLSLSPSHSISLCPSRTNDPLLPITRRIRYAVLIRLVTEHNAVINLRSMPDTIIVCSRKHWTIFHWNGITADISVAAVAPAAAAAAIAVI